MTDEMTDRLEGMLAKGQDNPLLRFGLGSNYFNQKNHDKALEHFMVCVEQEPTHSAAWKLLGRSYMALAQKDKAEIAFQEGLKAAKLNGDKQVEKEINVFLKKLHK